MVHEKSRGRASVLAENGGSKHGLLHYMHATSGVWLSWDGVSRAVLCGFGCCHELCSWQHPFRE